MATRIDEHTVPWPPEVAARYVAEGLWVGESLGDLLRRAAGADPGALALVDGQLRLTHGQLTARAGAVAARLRGLGLERGDRIVMHLANGWEFVVLTLACLRAGVVPVMALPRHRPFQAARAPRPRRGPAADQGRKGRQEGAARGHRRAPRGPRRMTDRQSTALTVPWMRQGTAVVRAAVESLPDESFGAPSALPGWTRAHVVGHLARNAEALTRLARWARAARMVLTWR